MFSQQPSPSAVIFTGHLVDCGKHTHTHKRELQGYSQVSELVKEGFIRAVGQLQYSLWLTVQFLEVHRGVGNHPVAQTPLGLCCRNAKEPPDCFTSFWYFVLPLAFSTLRISVTRVERQDIQPKSKKQAVCLHLHNERQMNRSKVKQQSCIIVSI